MITDIDGFMEDFTKRFFVPSTKASINNEETDTKLLKNLNKNEIRIIKAIDENSFTPEQLSETLLLPAYEILSLCISLTGKAFLKNVGAGRFMPLQKAVDTKNFLLANASC